jgi:hypothetical protein
MIGVGADVFVSYNRRDVELVRAVVAELAARGIAAVADDDIRAGDNWQAFLRSVLERAHVMLVMLGHSGLGAWQEAEVEVAIDRALHDPTLRVVPVILPGAPDDALKEHVFLARYEWLDLRAGPLPQQLDRLAAAIRGDGASPRTPRAPAAARNPEPSISASHGSVAAGSITGSIVIVGTARVTDHDDD